MSFSCIPWYSLKCSEVISLGCCGELVKILVENPEMLMVLNIPARTRCAVDSKNKTNQSREIF